MAVSIPSSPDWTNLRPFLTPSPGKIRKRQGRTARTNQQPAPILGDWQAGCGSVRDAATAGMESILTERGLALGICCHAYDVCTELIAREIGIIVTNEFGRPLQATLDVVSDVSLVGYVNNKIQQQIEPLRQAALKRRD